MLQNNKKKDPQRVCHHLKRLKIRVRKEGEVFLCSKFLRLEFSAQLLSMMLFLFFFSPSFDYLLIVWGRLLCWQLDRDVIREMETQIQYSRASVPLKATTEHQILPHIQTANQLQNAKKFSVRTNYPWVFAT